MSLSERRSPDLILCRKQDVKGVRNGVRAVTGKGFCLLGRVGEERENKLSVNRRYVSDNKTKVGTDVQYWALGRNGPLNTGRRFDVDKMRSARYTLVRIC